MRSLTLAGPPISLARIIRSPKPKEELEDNLIRLLSAKLKEFNVSWDAKAFKEGLNNPELPDGLLVRLEDFIDVAERLNWNLPKSFIVELDRLVEDIETFNPAFRKSIKVVGASNKRVSSLEIKKRLRL